MSDRARGIEQHVGYTTRLDGPDTLGGYNEISVYPDGRQSYTLDGDLHRINGPAFIGADGREVWHLHGREHRLDGPAVVYPDGYTEYWIAGVQLTEEQFRADARRPWRTVSNGP